MAVSDSGDVFLRKARECMAGATSEYANKRFNNVANRCYYACFQAAISALMHAGIRPEGDKDAWSHPMVQSQFAGVLVGRRKLYPAQVRNILQHLSIVRNQADYYDSDVSQTQARRALDRTRAMLAAIDAGRGVSQ